MGKSYIYHLIALGEKYDVNDNYFKRHEYMCMNKMELAQAVKNAKENGDKIVAVMAQTRIGVKSIGALRKYDEVPIGKIKLPKMIQCPICNGQGTKPLNKKGTLVRHCSVCNGSGITRPGYWKKWQDWQLNKMKAEFA